MTAEKLLTASSLGPNANACWHVKPTTGGDGGGDGGGGAGGGGDGASTKSNAICTWSASGEVVTLTPTAVIVLEGSVDTLADTLCTSALGMSYGYLQSRGEFE